MKELETFLKLKTSQKTKINYSNWINDFLQFKNIKDINDFANINLDDMVEYVDYLRNEKNNTDNSIKSKFRALSSFCNFLLESGLIEKNYSKYIIKNLNAQVNDNKRSFLTMDEQIRFLKECKSKREKAMFYLFLNNGLRVDELINLELDNFKTYKNEDGKYVGQITFRRKRNKIQTMYLNEYVTELINDYINNDRKDTPYNNIFISNWGNPMDTSNIDKTISKIAKRAGIDKKISAHSLRRSLATNLHNQGIDILGIKSILGHSSITTTQIYVKDDEKNANNILSNYCMKV